MSQKKSVTVAPAPLETGIFGVELRRSSIQLKGSSHWRFWLGPVIPLERPFAFWPQWPR